MTKGKLLIPREKYLSAGVHIGMTSKTASMKRNRIVIPSVTRNLFNLNDFDIVASLPVTLRVIIRLWLESESHRMGECLIHISFATANGDRDPRSPPYFDLTFPYSCDIILKNVYQTRGIIESHTIG